jgi:hypothetical protein
MNDKEELKIEKDANKKFAEYWKGIEVFLKGPKTSKNDMVLFKSIAELSFKNGYRNGKGLWDKETKIEKTIRECGCEGTGLHYCRPKIKLR